MAYRAMLKVRFGDIDQAGIVYYPRFLHYFHVAMEEFFRDEVGVDYAKVLSEHRFGFPTAHLETDFRRPLRYGDEIEVEVAVEKIGRSSVTWLYRVFKRGSPEIMAEAKLVTATLNLDTFKTQELPLWLRERLTQHVPM